MALEDLKKEADNLKVKYDEKTTEEDLKKAVDSKKQELSNDIDYWKKEAEKWQTEAKTAFDKRDRFKGEKDRLSKQLDEMEDKLKGMVPSTEKTQLEKDLKELQDFKADIDKKEEEKLLEQKSEVERLEMKISKQQEEFQKKFNDEMSVFKVQLEEKENKIKEMEDETEGLRLNGLKAEIVDEAARQNAFSPEQIYYLTKDKFTYDKKLRNYSHQVRKDGKLVDELSVKEFIKDFLSKEENENLIKSKINTNSFNSDKDKHTDTKPPEKLEGFNPNDPRIIKDAMWNHMEPEDYIKTVLIPQKEKREKRYGIKRK